MSIETQVKSEELYFEEDMPESQAQIDLNDYGKGVLKQQYASQNCFITGNLAIFPPVGNNYGFTNLAPDIVVFKGVSLTPEEKTNLTSWKMSEPNRPAPTVVFEVSSNETWDRDLESKPEFYRQLGVREYFAYDPLRLWRNATTQLRGWRYHNGVSIELQLDSQGRLWSEELESWLVPDGPLLRFYDREGNLRPTVDEASKQEEAAARQREAAERAARKKATQRVAVARQREADARQREEAERAAKEAALLEAQTERAELHALLEKLRLRNIDPDTL